MYRLTPVWYREGLPEVMITFSQVMCQDRPPNLHLMPSFPTPDLIDDGIHLTPFAGLEYILHLFDSSEAIMDGMALQPEEVLLNQCEVTRALTDRVTALEQDHKRLNKVVEDKIAIDAELADFRENERTQDCFTIEGLPLIPSEIVGKEWQVQAVAHVQEVLVALMGKEMNIIVVQNITNRFREGEVKYCVKMATVDESKAIRVKFGSFFLGGKGKQRPEPFKNISIRNRVTPATKVRIEILKFLGQRHKDANPGSRIQVIGFDPRPLLKILPPLTSSDKRVRVYNFIEAVKSLPTHLSPSESESLLQKVSLKFTGKLRSLFVMLSDDDFSRRNTKFKKSGGPSQGTSAQGSNPDQTESAMEVEPQPVIPAITSSAPLRVTQKRGPDPSEQGPTAKK